MGGGTRDDRCHARTQDARVDARVEHGGSQPFIGEPVSMGFGQALDQAVQGAQLALSRLSRNQTSNTMAAPPVAR